MILVNIQLIHFAIQQKLTQNCKATILQKVNFKEESKFFILLKKIFVEGREERKEEGGKGKRRKKRKLPFYPMFSSRQLSGGFRLWLWGQRASPGAQW